MSVAGAEPLPVRLARARAARGWSEDEVCRRLLLSRAQVRDLEAGRQKAFYTPYFHDKALRRYAELLDVSLDERAVAAAAEARAADAPPGDERPAEPPPVEAQPEEARPVSVPEVEGTPDLRATGFGAVSQELEPPTDGSARSAESDAAVPAPISEPVPEPARTAVAAAPSPVVPVPAAWDTPSPLPWPARLGIGGGVLALVLLTGWWVTDTLQPATRPATTPARVPTAIPATPLPPAWSVIAPERESEGAADSAAGASEDTARDADRPAGAQRFGVVTAARRTWLFVRLGNGTIIERSLEPGGRYVLPSRPVFLAVGTADVTLEVGGQNVPLAPWIVDGQVRMSRGALDVLPAPVR